MKLSAGVLSDTWLYWRNADGTLSWEAATGSYSAGYLAEMGIKHRLHTIWICPGTQFSLIMVDNSEYLTDVDTEEYRVEVKRNQYGVPRFGSVNKLRGSWDDKRIVYFGFPEHQPEWMTDDDVWALADVENPTDLTAIINSVEHALTPRRMERGQLREGTFRVAYSPGFCGMELLKEYMKLYAHVGWMRPADLSMLPVMAEPGGYKWKRALTAEEAGKQYIHFYDRNAQFPAAATGAELGEGTPIHLETYTDKVPGVWHINVTEAPEAYERVFPPITHCGEQWAYTATIQALKAAGYVFTVQEGWAWTVHHRTLQDWAKGLWEGRKELREQYGKGSPQDNMAKMIVNRGMGWLDLGTVKKRGRNPEKDMDNRPDWYNTVRALARYRLTLKIIEMGEKHGMYPVMIVADNIAYVSDEPNAELAAPGLMVRKTELGGFKHDGTYLLSEVLPLMKEYDPDTIRKHVKQLKKVGE